jgi:hypothetical protein
MYQAMVEFEDIFSQVQKRLVWPPTITRFSLESRFAFATMGSLVYGLRHLVGDSTFKLVFVTIVPSAVGPWSCERLTCVSPMSLCVCERVLRMCACCTGGLALLVWILVAIGWIFVLQQYRREVLDGRRGVWTFDPSTVNVMAATRFIGCASVHVAAWMHGSVRTVCCVPLGLVALL